VRDLTPVANFRTRVEAELAARFLDIPYVISSGEGGQYGPLGDGTTIFVRANDVSRARDLLGEPGPEHPTPVDP
jgi:hypothetical protein